MGDRLTLEVDEFATPDAHEMSRVKFYTSSLLNEETGEPLISLATRGPGMRLTKAQAIELHDWLGEWLTQ